MWKLYPTAKSRAYKTNSSKQVLAARNLAGCHAAGRCEDFAARARSSDLDRALESDCEAQAYSARESITNWMVACGFSSMIQCPGLGTIPPVTLLAANCVRSAMFSPKNISAPMADTGMVILPSLASNALLSTASWRSARHT